MIGMVLVAGFLVFCLNFASNKHSGVYESFSHSRLASDLMQGNGNLHLIGGRGTVNGYITLVAPLDYTQPILFSDIESTIERRFSNEPEAFSLKTKLLKYKNEDVGFVLSWESRSNTGKLVVFAVDRARKTRNFAGSDMAVFGFSFAITEEIRDR